MWLLDNLKLHVSCIIFLLDRLIQWVYMIRINSNTLQCQQGLPWPTHFSLIPSLCHSLFTLVFYQSLKDTMEKAMAPHSSTLAWKIPWAEEPGRLQSVGSLRVGHDWATSLSLFTFMHWRRKWQPTPVFLPGESQGQGNLVGCSLWGRTESDMTEAT